MKFILSTNDKNRKGYIVETQGIEIPESLPLFFNHDPSKVLGEWINIEKEGDNLIAEAVFDYDDAEAIKVEKKVKKGLIKGSSIGFSPMEQDVNDDGTLIITKSRINEASIVAIPANDNAVKLFNENGIEMTENDILTLSLEHKNKYNKMEITKQLIKILGVDEDKILETIESLKSLELNIQEKQELIMKNEDSYNLSLVEKDKSIAELQDTVNSYEEKEEKAKINSLIDTAIEDGKILETQKDEYLALSKNNIDTIKTLFEKAPKRNLNDVLDFIETEDKDLDPKLSWGFDDWSKKDPKGLLDMKQNDLGRYDILYGKQFFQD
jgi:HK97 family phage prohead protease